MVTGRPRLVTFCAQSSSLEATQLYLQSKPTPGNLRVKPEGSDLPRRQHSGLLRQQLRRSCRPQQMPPQQQHHRHHPEKQRHLPPCKPQNNWLYIVHSPIGVLQYVAVWELPHCSYTCDAWCTAKYKYTCRCRQVCLTLDMPGSEGSQGPFSFIL
jgi:hypothetical protein